MIISDPTGLSRANSRIISDCGIEKIRFNERVNLRGENGASFIRYNI